MPSRSPSLLNVLRGLARIGAVAFPLIVPASPLAAQVSAAARVTGIVLDGSGQPVPVARVTLRSDAAEVARGVTDARGAFALSGLPAGRFALEVSAIGYRLARRDLTLRAADSIAVDIALVQAPVELADVVVTTPTRSATPLESVPAAVTVITRQEIATQARLTPQLGAILTQLVPGLSAGTQSLSNYGQSFRGRRVAVLIDGVPQSTTRDAARDFATIDPAAVERIEVVRGATSIYGDGATGGIINIITRSGAAGPLRLATEVVAQTAPSDVGAAGGGRFVQSASGGVGAFDYALTGSFTRTGGFFDAEGDRIPADPHGQGGVAEMNTWDLLGKAGYRFGPQRVEFMVNRFQSEQNSEYTTDPTVNAADPGTVKARSIPGRRLERQPGAENTVAQLGYEHAGLAGMRVTGKLFYRDYLTRFAPYDGRSFPSLGSSIIQSYVDSEKLGGRLQFETEPSATTGFVWGLDFIGETTSQPVGIMDPAAYDASNGLVFSQIGERGWVPPTTARSVAAFGQGTWQLARPVSIHAGVRHERARVSVDDFMTIRGDAIPGGRIRYAPVMVNAGVVLTPSEAVSLYGAFSQGFSLADVGRVLRDAAADFSLGSQALEAQKVNHYEIGARGSAGPAQVSFSTFYNTSELGRSFNADLEIVRAPERVYGVEATLDLAPADYWQVGGNFTWSEGENDADGNGEYLALDGYRIQPIKLGAYLQHQTLRGWANRLQLLHSGSRARASDAGIGYGGAPVRSYTVLDFITTLEIGPGSLSAGIENLLNAQYFPGLSQLEGGFANTTHSAARGRQVSVGYSVSYGVR